MDSNVQCKGITNSQYEDLFNTVIESNLSQSLPQDRSPYQANSPKEIGCTPIENALLENSYKSQHQNRSNSKSTQNKLLHEENKKTASFLSKKEKNLLDEVTSRRSLSQEETSLSTSKNNLSTVKKNKSEIRVSKKKVRKEKVTSKHNDDITFQEAIAILKETHTESSLNDSFSMELYENQLSQPPRTFSHRERLEWLQERRNIGIWVFCDKPGCNKQRWLENVKDPTELPDKWYCQMNPGTYNFLHILVFL